MQRKTKLFKKVSLIGLLLTTVICFSNCKKDVNGGEGALLDSTQLFSANSNETLAATSGSTGVITISGFKSEGGYGYKTSQSIAGGDTQTEKSKSILRLFENGVELGPAHSVHDDIRNLGKGRFSHWGTSIIFSASDNSDPRTNGRAYTYVLGTSTGTVTPPVTAPITSNPTVTTGIMGYAMVNGSTTGGKGGAEVTVTTVSALKAALGDNVTRTVYVSGTIKGAGVDPIYVKSNKSIIGKSGAVLEGIEFFVYGVNNIIFQNLTFKNYVTYAAVQIKEAAHHIWIDHCEFSTDRTHGWEYWGKDITITRESDYVTVSWNKFHDTNLSVLIGGGIEGHEADAGKLHVTLHHNFWYNITEREPSMNYGRVHMFNNYHLNNSGYSIGVRAGGIVRTDNEYFSNCVKPLSTKVADSPEGYFSGVTTNIYNKCGTNNITTAVSNWVPEYDYKGYLNDAASVPSLVTNGSGPK